MTSPIPTTDAAFPGQWIPVAERICARHAAEFPDVVARYGDRGQAYCIHDGAYLVAWLVDELDAGPAGSFGRNVGWLWSVLDARGYPADSFRRSLELLADELVMLRPDDAGRITVLVTAAVP
jgi:hypothetical protein